MAKFTEKDTPSGHFSDAMVVEAVENLDEKGGSSIQAVRKYIADVHKVDVNLKAIHIWRALQNAVQGGQLDQSKGSRNRAAGYFKLSVKQKTASTKKPGNAKVKARENQSKISKYRPTFSQINSAQRRTKPTPAKTSRPKSRSSNIVERPVAEKKTTGRKPTKQDTARSKKAPARSWISVNQLAAPVRQGEQYIFLPRSLLHELLENHRAYARSIDKVAKFMTP